MSTSAPSTTIPGGGTTTGSPSPSPSRPDSDTATLYLFTFLATILILVLLSASLVLRSFVLRRRYRQRLQEALADGLFADLDGFPGSARQPAPKPVVWDTWIRPADKDATWSSITPVAVRCSPSLSPPSTSPQRPVTRHDSHPLLPHLHTPRPSLPQVQSPVGSPILTTVQSPPPAVPTSPDPSVPSEKDAATLTIYVLVVMPDPVTPVHRPTPDAKGKGVDPPASPPHPQTGNADPLLPSSRRRSGPSVSDTALEGERQPLLEFGVVEATAGEWIWRT